MRDYRSMALLLIMAALIGLTLLPVQPADASEPWRYRWEIRFDFEKSLHGVLIVKTLRPSDGLTNEGEYPVECTSVPQNAVTHDLANGKAIFNGGYLECTLSKSIYQAVSELAQGHSPLIITDYDPIRMGAQLQLDTTKSAPNTLFYHPDIELAVPYDTAVAQAHIRARASGQYRSSLPFIPAASGDRVGVTHYFDDNINDCRARFTLGTAVLNRPQYNCPVAPFNTTVTTVYVGANPNNGIPLYGEIEWLDIDPENWGVMD